MSSTWSRCSHHHPSISTCLERKPTHCARYFPAALKPRHQVSVGLTELVITVGDLAEARAQVIVNASNRRLELGGGVSGSLRARFGDALQHHMRRQASRELEDGELVLTSHPVSSGVQAIYHVASAAGDEDTIRCAIHNVLDTAHTHSHSHVVMPALGCGTGGMTIAAFGEILLERLRDHHHDIDLELWLWTLDDLEAFLSILA